MQKQVFACTRKKTLGQYWLNWSQWKVSEVVVMQICSLKNLVFKLFCLSVNVSIIYGVMLLLALAVPAGKIQEHKLSETCLYYNRERGMRKTESGKMYTVSEKKKKKKNSTVTFFLSGWFSDRHKLMGGNQAVVKPTSSGSDHTETRLSIRLARQNLQCDLIGHHLLLLLVLSEGNHRLVFV